MILVRRRPATAKAVEFLGTNFDELEQAFENRWMTAYPLPGEYVVEDAGEIRSLHADQYHSLYEPLL